MSESMTQNHSINQRFKIGPVLGRGGMATVYRAYDTVTEQTIAIKILYDHLREHPFVSERFRQEVVISQSLEHPNIVKVHSLFDTPQQLGMVMELHGTGDLKNYLMRNGAMPWEKVVKIGAQILQALEVAHQAGVVHQDIKPHNILLDDNDLAKLIDFGAARIDEAIALARPESAMATVEYSAPEQFDDLAIDARADLYSLGITLFEMLSNTLPYRSETAAGVIQMHREAPVADIRVFVRNIPEHIAETLLRAMAKEPENRFESATEMRLALENQVNNPLVPMPRFHAWEYLKTQSNSDATQTNWNLFLHPLALTKHLRLDGTQRETQAMAVVDIFLEYQNDYRGTHHLEELKRQIKTSEGQATTHGPESDDHASFLAEYGLQSIFDQIQTKWQPIPLACSLTFAQAAKIRYQFGSAGIEVSAFQCDISSETSLEQMNKTLPPKGVSVASVLRLLALISLPMVPTFITVALISFFLGPELTLASFIDTALGFSLFTLPFAAATAYLGYCAKAPDSLLDRKALLQSANYLLQFNATPPETTQREQKLLQKIHAATYHSLQSKRLRATYERIILQLVQHATSENLTHTEHRLMEATILAQEIAATEQRLTGQSHATLFAQLARIDAQLAHITDTDLTAEFIEQKLALTQQLRKLDDNRQKLTTLGNELLALQKR